MINEYIKGLVREETKKILLYKDKKCKKCEEPAECIHHSIYRWKPKIEDIVFLCKHCHKKFKGIKQQIIIEDSIDYSLLTKWTHKDEEFLEKIKKLDKDLFTCIDTKKVDKRTHSIRMNHLKKLEHLNLIERIDKNTKPIVFRKKFG